MGREEGKGREAKGAGKKKGSLKNRRKRDF